jgi:hypothetical protein
MVKGINPELVLTFTKSQNANKKDHNANKKGHIYTIVTLLLRSTYSSDICVVTFFLLAL